MDKKHALIIGGTKGIGKALVKEMITKGCVVSIIARHPPKDIQDIDYWKADITREKKLLGVLKEIVSKNGKLNYLVFFQRYRGDKDNWDAEIETSLTATKNIVEYTADKFDDKKDKAIVIVSSLAGCYIADEQPISYHVAKAGLNHMGRFYAVLLGNKNIRVNCISFGAVLKDESKDFYLKNKKLHNFYKKITPLGRMASSEDIADVVSFLCSEKASFITGQNIIVDGGISAQSHESLTRKLTHLRNLNVLRKKENG